METVDFWLVCPDLVVESGQWFSFIKFIETGIVDSPLTPLSLSDFSFSFFSIKQSRTKNPIISFNLLNHQIKLFYDVVRILYDCNTF